MPGDAPAIPRRSRPIARRIRRARQPGRAQRGSRCPAGHRRALWRGDASPATRRRCGGSGRRHGALGREIRDLPTRRAASTGPMPRSRGWTALLAALPAADKAAAPPPAARPPGGTARSRSHAGGVEEGDALSADGPLARLCRAKPMPMRCSTCGGRRRRAPPTAGSWRKDAQGRARRATACSTPPSSSRISTPPTPRSTRWSGPADLALLPRRSDAATPIPSAAYAEVTAAQARVYGNQLGEAWERITRSGRRACQQMARLALYQVARARGWPRRAEVEAEIAASLDPDSAAEDRAGRNRDQRLPLRRGAAHGRRAAGAIPRGPAVQAAGARTRRRAALGAGGPGEAQQLARRRRQRLGPGDACRRG